MQRRRDEAGWMRMRGLGEHETLIARHRSSTSQLRNRSGKESDWETTRRSFDILLLRGTIYEDDLCCERLGSKPEVGSTTLLVTWNGGTFTPAKHCRENGPNQWPISAIMDTV